MTGRFDGKVALVTGGGAGMGRAIALRFAEDGAVIVAADVKIAAAEETVRLASERGSEGLALQADVSAPESVQALREAMQAEFGRLEVLVNNAGVEDGFVPAGDMEDDVWRRTLAINLDGPQHMTRALLPLLLASGGCVLNIASAGGLKSGAGGAAYTASKHGLIGYTRQLARDYGPQGVRAVAICPGVVETAMTAELLKDPNGAVAQYIDALPLRRAGKPEEIAAVAAFLASDEAAYIHGAAIVVDGGWLV